MEWLNYHHLLYFWVVAKQGSIVGASRELRLAHPTISGQIHRLEEVLGQKLFSRHGRNLTLTDEGRVAFRYAEEIFGLGQEFLDTVKGRPGVRRMRLVVGISGVLAKSIVQRVLAPVFEMNRDVLVVCRDGRSVSEFMTDLAENEVDVVLSDAPAGPGSPIRAFSHLLGECGVTFFATSKLARRLQRRFPRSLEGAPFLTPTVGSTLQRSLARWFDSMSLRPRIIAEVPDVALANIFGEAGLGVFVGPTVIEQEVRQRYRVHIAGRTEKVQQQVWAISLEKRIKHPAVAAICDEARESVFA